MADRLDLRGRTLFITGPARGIGAATARLASRRGARVALAGLEPERLEELAAELGEAAVFETDVRSWESLEAAVAGTVERFGGVDVVVANAGIAPVGTVETIDRAAFEATIDVNLLGVWRTLRATLPHVIERRGHMLPIASLAAAIHGPLTGHYSAAKAGVEALGDVLRAEIAPQGVTVGVAYFGFIDTDMVRNAFEHPATPDAAERARRGAMLKPVPVERAAQAIVRGIERRSRKVVAPRRVWPLLMAPEIFQRVMERGGARQVRETVERANRLARSGGPRS